MASVPTIVYIEDLTCWQDELSDEKDSKDEIAACTAQEEEKSETVAANNASSTIAIDNPTSSIAATTASSCKFPVNVEVNRQVYLWKGDLLDLDVAAIVNSTNEPMTDRSGLCGRVFERAGPELVYEVDRLEGCRTGESKMTKGYNLHARYVIHTVGPRYNARYKTAAENALHNCYRSCLQMVKENNLKTIAFSVVNSEKRGYPRENGAHIALRTVKRFMEHYGKGLQAVVFALSRQADYLTYKDVLPIYFPRTAAEEAEAIKKLPADTGNEFGETVIQERKIRISAFPGHMSDDEEVEEIHENEIEQENTGTQDSACKSSSSESMAGLLTKMEGDLDANIISGSSYKSHASDHEEIERTYAHYLKRSKTEDISDIARRNIIYIPGKTALGRTVVVIIGHHLPQTSSTSEMERVLMYIIRTMDPIVEKEYIIVYAHSPEHQPDMDWLRKVYNIWDAKYSANIQGFFVLHPTFWLKVFWTVLRPFLSTQFYKKLRYIDGLQELFEILDHDQLRLPESVHLMDRKLNGKLVLKETDNGL